MSLCSIVKRVFGREQTSASIAKERLQIIISQERVKNTDNFLPLLQRDLIDVISKYFKVDTHTLNEQLKVDLEQVDGRSVLELNITLPEMSLQETANQG